MKPKLPAILIATLLLAGCAPTVWYKAGATQADFNTDSYGCEKDARQSGYFGSGLAGALEMKDFYGRCMVAHGYTARKQ